MKPDLSDAIFIVAVVLGFICLMTWILQPSPFQVSDTRYAECLRTVLQKGTIEDAELMCRHLR